MIKPHCLRRTALRLLLIGCGSYLLPMPTQADDLVISPSSDHTLIQAINHAKQHIDVVMYGFTRQDLTKALIRAQQRAVSIRLLLENHPYLAAHENDQVKKQLEQHHIIIKDASPAFSLTHQKTLVIDHTTAFIMTGNFTYSSQYRQRNLTVITHNPRIIHDITRTFNDDWHRQPSHSHNAQLLWSPDNSEIKIKRRIEQAHHLILCANQSLTDPVIIQALTKKAQAGVKVLVIIPQSTAPRNKILLNHLKQQGAQIHELAHPYLHEKLLIIDPSLPSASLLIGSMNFTTPGLTKNRELGIWIHSPALIDKALQNFQHDWTASNALKKARPWG